MESAEVDAADSQVGCKINAYAVTLVRVIRTVIINEAFVSDTDQVVGVDGFDIR